MTLDQLIAEMQSIMGESYTVSKHPVTRSHPQIDVKPNPEQHDPDGNPYGVTFTVRKKDLAEVPEDRHKLLAALWASTCDTDIRHQIQRGKAGGRLNRSHE